MVPPSVTHAIICLHGFGSSGDDLIALAPALRSTLGNLGESLAIYAPHGPAFVPGATEYNPGYQWFSDRGWTFRDPEGLARLLPELDAFIAHVAQTHDIPTSHIALLGFSQGAMTALHCAPGLRHQPGAIISCCGAISVPPLFGFETTKPPVLLLHGAEDDVLPADASVTAAQTFTDKGYPTQLEILPNLGHGIDAATVAHISVFLQSVWVD